MKSLPLGYNGSGYKITTTFNTHDRILRDSLSIQNMATYPADTEIGCNYSATSIFAIKDIITQSGVNEIERFV